MPLNVYCGLMRSGKSYEVVAEVIVPSIRKGRRVVTNVDGISQDAIHAYLLKKYPDDDASKYGVVVHVTNAQVFQPDFFPYYDDQKDAHTDTIVQPGDLVAIDEAWRFWGDKMKIQKNHQSFFLEHGHFTHPDTHVACDLVLMIQDMGTLHRSVKAVVAFVFRTHRKAALGLANTYSVNGYEGNRMNKATRIGTWVRKYQKDVFPLYSSFKGGAEGKLVNADNRQNMFAQKKFIWYLGGYVVLLVFAVWTIYSFFGGSEKTPVAASVAAPVSPVGAAVSVPVVVPQQRAAVVQVNETWRVAGSMYADGKGWVVLVNQAGAVRVESPSAFTNSGLAVVGDVDGTKVTSWSGPSGQTDSIVGGQQPAARPIPAPAQIVGGR